MTGPAPECVALAEGLRDMRARTGLSLAALAERTAYSKSSWERYLNGKSPVPRQAVDGLCTMAGEPAGRLLALWELADAEWSGRARRTLPAARSAPALAPVDAGAPGSGSAGPGRVRRQWLFTVAVGVAAVATAALLTASAVRGRDADPPASPASPVLDPEPGCQGKVCDGKDPDQMFCGLPSRVTSLAPPHRTATGARVEIRYSPVCAAAWGRIWHAETGDAIEISTPDSRPRRVVVMSTSDTDAYRFTLMIGGPDRTRLHLCFLPAGGPDRECVDS
ncbi:MULTISPECIES: helix-turn-helix domain-containing protein [unclassified Streptomyces]|uniref:helix-turn-helix domain-containing protein n=1 Tax=unclassified Streptomyces TaxID=2593676 RepID=UPI002F90E581